MGWPEIVAVRSPLSTSDNPSGRPLALKLRVSTVSGSVADTPSDANEPALIVCAPGRDSVGGVFWICRSNPAWPLSPCESVAVTYTNWLFAWPVSNVQLQLPLGNCSTVPTEEVMVTGSPSGSPNLPLMKAVSPCFGPDVAHRG